MARRGSPVDETIECAGIGSGEATDRLLAVAASEYRAVNVGANRFQFARTYRPTWTIVCAICLFPIGLLFLLVRSTETWAATVEEDHRRVRVRLTGPVLAHVLVAARTALTAGPLVAPVAPSPGVVADPVSTPAASGPAAPGILAQPVAVPAPMTPPPSAASVPSWAAPVAPPPAALPHPGAWPAAPPAPAELVAPHAAAVAPPPSPAPPQAVAAPAPAPAPVPARAPVPSWIQEDPRVRADATQVVPVEAVRAATVVLAFDTGETVPGESLMLVGRDPERGPDESAAVLVPVADPELSVSKTHLSVGLSDGAAWACDRGSTNGTSIGLADGSVIDLTPGERVPIGPGATVRFGARSFVVTLVEGGGGSG